MSRWLGLALLLTTGCLESGISDDEWWVCGTECGGIHQVQYATKDSEEPPRHILRCGCKNGDVWNVRLRGVLRTAQEDLCSEEYERGHRDGWAVHSEYLSAMANLPKCCEESGTIPRAAPEGD